MPESTHKAESVGLQGFSLTQQGLEKQMYMQSQTNVAGHPWSRFPTVTFYGVSVLAVTEIQCVKVIMDALESQQGGWCVTVHLNILRQITLDTEIRKLVQDSTFCTADGISLVWASHLCGTPLPERVCGCDLIYSLTDEAARRGRSIFLLGGNPGAAQDTAEILKQRYTDLNVVGIYCPSFGFEQDLQQIAEMTEAIRSTKPDIVYVALGFPKQEKLIAKIRHVRPNAWWIGVGISFSYVSCEFKRAPRWVQRTGLETFYRVTLEPRRLAKRYCLQNPPFLAKLLFSSLLKRFSIGTRSQAINP